MHTDPRTKSDFLNRMMSFDFDGDIRHIGAENATITRIRANAIKLVFPTTGKEFELVVRMPRGPKPIKAAAKTPARKAAASKKPVKEAAQATH